jgi:hypothetical protein
MTVNIVWLCISLGAVVLGWYVGRAEARRERR